MLALQFVPVRTDEELMARYVEGHAASFDELFQRYSNRVYGYFCRTLGDRELATDLLQTTFLRLHLARHNYDPTRSLATWLFTIAANLRRDALRARARNRVVDGSPPERAADSDPEKEVLAGETRLSLDAALAQIDAQQREVIVLHKMGEQSFPEISKILGVSVEALKTRAFRGYRALRKVMQERQEQLRKAAQ